MNSEDSYNTGSPRGDRSLQELFYTPRPQVRSVAITRYPEMRTYRLPTSLPFNEIYRLYSRVASLNGWLVDAEPTDGAKILAATKRSIAGGAK